MVSVQIFKLELERIPNFEKRIVYDEEDFEKFLDFNLFSKLFLIHENFLINVVDGTIIANVNTFHFSSPISTL